MAEQTKPLGRHAVVVGGSMAGLLSARVLAEHFDRVTVLERDRLPEGPDARKGVPQARHVHVLLVSGRKVFERLFPGLLADYVASGATEMDSARDIEWLTGAGWGVRFPSHLRLVGATRDLLEWGVRRRIAAVPRITVRSAVDVSGLVLNPDGRRVSGVSITDRGGVRETVPADLVVDASGRGSKGPAWLEAIGFPKPPETVVNSFLGYASRLIRKPTRWAADWSAFYIQHAPPARKRGGLIFPVEGDRWLVTLSGAGKDYPPTDEAEWWEFARSLADPRFAAAIEAGEPLTPVVSSRSTENRLRHYEKLTRQPEAFLAIGDAVCSFNPVYGQGMSTAALGAAVLERCLRDCNPGRVDGLAGRFQRRLARSNANAWLVATGEDYRFAEVEGPPPGLVTRILHRYFDRVTRLSTKHAKIRLRLLEVQQLTRPPSSLFHPGVAARAAVVGT